MPRPIHFEIPAENPERAMQFYSKVFGWKFNKWAGPMDYWVISTGQPGEPGIDGGLMPRRDPNQPCVNTGRDRQYRRVPEDRRRERGNVRGAEDGRPGSGLAGVLQGYRGTYIRDHADGSRGGLRESPWQGGIAPLAQRPA